MNSQHLKPIIDQYRSLRVAIVGDFCLDRYLEIDPDKKETSIETGLPVYNVVQVRSQPGAAGTILNNLVALGVGDIYPVGFAGQDGEGFELLRSLASKPGVRLGEFVQTDLRRTFTYCKPLLVESGKAPIELNRLDSKNWSPTPTPVRQRIQRSIQALADRIDALILLDQVDLADTGVVTGDVLETIEQLGRGRPGLFIIADSRRSLRGFPPVCFKMNKAEFKAMIGISSQCTIADIRKLSGSLAIKQGRHVFITLADEGIIGASPAGETEHVAALPIWGEIDVVGAGDAVTANLATSLAAGASLRNALELAMRAASIVVHQLGTTGTASASQLLEGC